MRRAIATDVGGGTNYSMLRTLDEGYKVLALRGQKLDPLKAFWWITRGNAEALSLADRIGTLAPGSEADVVVLDSAATPAMALRRETIATLAEELFLLETLGRRPGGGRRPMSRASAGCRRRRGRKGRKSRRYPHAPRVHIVCTKRVHDFLPRRPPGRALRGGAPSSGGMKPPLGRRLAVGRLCGLPPAEAGFAR